MEFTEVIRRRNAVRAYQPIPVEPEKLRKILEAGRLAPTAINRQPQKIYVLQSEDALKRMDSVSPCRYGAQTVLLVCSDREQALEFGGMNFFETDACIVATHMLLAATDLGVDDIWLAIADRPGIRAAFGLPKNIEPICFIDLGYQTEDYAGNPMHDSRKPLSETVSCL